MAQRFHLGDLQIRSAAFDNHGPIPSKHTSDGENVAPALEWSGAPEGDRIEDHVLEQARLVGTYEH